MHITITERVLVILVVFFAAVHFSYAIIVATLNVSFVGKHRREQNKTVSVLIFQSLERKL